MGVSGGCPGPKAAKRLCVCVCVRACMRACVRVCLCVCVNCKIFCKLGPRCFTLLSVRWLVAKSTIAVGNYGRCWTMLRVLSPALGSLIAALVRYCTTNCLAWRSRPGSFQASSDSSPVSERPRTTVSVGALHLSLQCWHAAASLFCQPSPTWCTLFPAQHLRPSGVLSRWPDGLEVSPWFYPRSIEQYRLF